MKNQKKDLNKKIKEGKVSMKLKTAFLMLFITIFSISGIMTVDSATISDDGKYTLILTSNEENASIDGESGKILRFNVAEGETTVKLSELTKGIVPFNRRTEFSYWGSFTGEKTNEEIAITDFSWSGNFEGKTYTNGLTLYAKFSDKLLQGTGTYYLTLDAFAGKVHGQSIVNLTSKSTEFKTVDLTKYTPVREGYTFKGWDLDGKIVTSIDSSYFANRDCVTVTATYTQDTFKGDGIVLILNANGGTIDGKAFNKYDYLGGGNSGTNMSLLPYIPIREGYTFNGWNTKKDSSGENYKYVYWRFWDKNEETDKEFEKDTLIKEESGYERYKNVTLYASWTKISGEPEQPIKETVKEIQSTGETKAKIEFAKEVSKDYKLDIKPIEVKKELADKNVKIIADIKVLDGNNVVKISDTKMKIRIALPEDLKGYDKYEVAYILNDEIQETIPAMVESGYIVFETSHLSQYGIIATNTGFHNHSYSTAWKYDETNHWHECACGDKADNAVHDFRWVVDKEATETEKGSKHEECTICGYKKAAVDISVTDYETKLTDQGNKIDNTALPKTGDTSNMLLWIALLFVSGGAVISTTVVSRKKKYNR